MRGSVRLALAMLGADDDGLRADVRLDRRTRAEEVAEAAMKPLRNKSEEDLAIWVVTLPAHPRFRRADDRDVDDELVAVTHVVTGLEPHERGYFVYVDPSDMKLYRLPYSAR